MKFLIDKYYLFLIIIILCMVFNVTIRDPLINWIYSTSTDKSVTNANAYANATKMKNIFSYILVGCLAFIGILSIILLIVPGGRVML